jgi:hypothetical protein
MNDRDFLALGSIVCRDQEKRVLSQIFLATELGLERWTGLSRQRIELLRWTQFACRSQPALADHVHEFDASKGRCC